LSIEFPARVNARALGGAVLTGAGLSAVLVASYLAGGAAKTALARSHSVRVATAASATAPPQLTPTPAALQLAPSQAPVTPIEVQVARGQGALDCLTDAVYYEARGESDRGQAAVAQVVLNRVRRNGFPKSVCGVVFQGASEHACQFSFACDGAMRQDREPAAWRRARGVAQRALDGVVMEDVGDATNFHVARLGQIWGSGLVEVAQVGAHVFYKLTGHGTFVAHPAAGHDSALPDGVTSIPADGGDQASLILASAVTVKAPLGEGGPVGPPPEPASAPAISPPKPPAAPAAKAPAAAAAPVATAAKADG
jgi:spore germination cell wall hydrolase CwlJ-like protein